MTMTSALLLLLLMTSPFADFRCNPTKINVLISSRRYDSGTGLLLLLLLLLL